MSEVVSRNPEPLAHSVQVVPVQTIIDLWNNEGGWIPGAAYEELARLLGVSTDRLTHYDQSKPEGQRRHTVLGPRQIERGDADE